MIKPLAESMKHKGKFRPNPFKPVIRQELAVLIVRLRQSAFQECFSARGMVDRCQVEETIFKKTRFFQMASRHRFS